MFLYNLPVELLDTICSHVPRPGLAALSQTSRSLHPVAQRVLYRRLSVSPFYRNLDVLTTLASRPDVAFFVRSISINLDTSLPVLHASHTLLATALSHMPELTSLDMCINPHASWVLTELSTYPRLHRLACSFTLDSNVADFLTKTPSLQELELNTPAIFHPSVLSSSLPLPAIPSLRQFFGSSETARVIVPGRPLESIYLNSGELAEEDIKCLANGTARVRIFAATTRSLPNPLLDLLDLLARHLPHVVYLRIMTTHTFPTAPDVVSDSFLKIPKISLTETFPEQAFYEQVANRLAALSDLSAFELSGMHWGSRRGSDKRVWHSHPLATAHSDGTAYETEPSLPY